MQYGLIPEFVGRLPIIATLEELDAEALIRILTEPRNALTKQYAKMFEMEGVEIDFRDDGLQAIAERAMERKTGARGLRSIFLRVYFWSLCIRFPRLQTWQRSWLTNRSSEGDSEPLLVYETPSAAAAGAEERCNRRAGGWRDQSALSAIQFNIKPEGY